MSGSPKGLSIGFAVLVIGHCLGKLGQLEIRIIWPTFK
jgi:hypothetical protein